MKFWMAAREQPVTREPMIAVALTVMHSARFDGNPAQAVS
jgi:hypothetical protein